MQENTDWTLVRAAARLVRSGMNASLPADFIPGPDGELIPAQAADPQAMLRWQPGEGWCIAGPPSAFLDLYLPVAGSHGGAPLTVGHLGQSLDGFIATASGDSCYVTGPANVRHLHRMRALCDAIIVGAGTVAADDPQLTTRHVPGPNPLRVVLDRARRLDDQYGVFNDGAAPTLLVCSDSAPDRPPPGPCVELLRIPASDGRLDLAALVRHLHARGCVRIFVEGGGTTVSAFLAAGLLDRLQIAVAPLLIGDGRPAIRLPASLTLAECRRLHPRVFSMGQDMLFDCDLSAAGQRPPPATVPEIRRVR